MLKKLSKIVQFVDKILELKEEECIEIRGLRHYGRLSKRRERERERDLFYVIQVEWRTS